MFVKKYQLELRWAALDGTSSLDAEEEGDNSSDAGEKTCVLESKNELEKLLGYCFTHSVSSSSPVAAEGTLMAASSSSFGFGHHRRQSTGEDHKPGGRGETLSRSPPATTEQGDVLRLGGAKEQHNSVIALHGATIVDSTMMSSPEVDEVRGMRSDGEILRVEEVESEGAMSRGAPPVRQELQLPEELIHSSGGTKATLLQPDGSEKTLFGVERGLGNGTNENLLQSSQNTLLQVSPAVSATAAKRAGTYGGALTGTALTDLDNYIDNSRCGSAVSAKRASYYNQTLTGTALTDLGTTRVRENCGGENAREEATAVLAQVAAEQLQSPSPQSPSPQSPSPGSTSAKLAEERKVPMMIPTKSTTDGEDLAPDVENLAARGAERLGSRAPSTQAPPKDPQRRVDLECRLGEEDALPVLLDSDHRRNAIANWDPWDYSQSSTSGGPSQGPMDATSQTDEHRSNLSQKSQSNLSSQRGGHYHASNVSSRLTVLNPQEASTVSASSKSSKETVARLERSYLSPSSSKERARRQRRESLQRMLELPGSSSARSSSKDREVEQEEASRGGVSPSRFQREAENEPGIARLEATRNANPASAAPEAGSSSREVGLSTAARAGGMENRVLVVHSTSRAASTSAATSASLVSVEELRPTYLGRPHDAAGAAAALRHDLEHQGSSGTSSIVLLRGGPASTGNNSSSRNSTGCKSSGGQNSAWNSPETSDSIDLFLPVVSSGEDAEKRSTAGFRGGSLLQQYARVAGALLVRPGSVEKAADGGIGGTTTEGAAGKRSGHPHLTATNAGGVKITPRNSATGNFEIRLEDHAVHKTSTDGTNHNASAHPHPSEEQEQERATSQDRNSSNAKSGASTQTLRGFQGLTQKLANAKNLSKENLSEKLFPGDSASNYCGAGSASQGSEVNNQEQKFAGQYATSSSSGSSGSRSCSRDPLFELRRRWEAVEQEERKARAAAATPNGEAEANDQEPGHNHEATMKSKRTRGARRSESRGELWSSRGKTGAGGRGEQMYQSRADRSLRLLQTAVQGGQRTKEKTETREKTILSLSEYRPGGARNLSPRSRFFGSSEEWLSAAKSNEKAQDPGRPPVPLSSSSAGGANFRGEGDPVVPGTTATPTFSSKPPLPESQFSAKTTAARTSRPDCEEGARREQESPGGEFLRRSRLPSDASPRALELIENIRVKYAIPVSPARDPDRS